MQIRSMIEKGIYSKTPQLPIIALFLSVSVCNALSILMPAFVIDCLGADN